MTPLDPIRLAPHYARFRVSERILLTGHSHQAWPDVSFEAQQQAWLDAAEAVDRKWERALVMAAAVARGFAQLLGHPDQEIALGQNTHELVVRLLSALPLRQRPRIVTTDGEFHTLRRQLDRLAETGIELHKVPCLPVETLAERLAALVTDHTAMVGVSSVLFETGAIVPGLAHLAAACERHGTELLVDAYHHVNVVPFDLAALGLERAFIVGGGYKYCQMGEGNCFLRVPRDCRLRPVVTGWFAEFAEIEHGAHDRRVGYGRGAAAFAGSTYDPTSHYRGAEVFAFHRRQAMTPERLRALNQQQTADIIREFSRADLAPSRASVVEMPAEQRGGFVAIRLPNATAVVDQLNAAGIRCDARGAHLRLGPAPYVTTEQLSDGVRCLVELVRNSPADPVA